MISHQVSVELRELWAHDRQVNAPDKRTSGLSTTYLQ